MRAGSPDNVVEFGRGAWHCRLSADSTFFVIRKRRLAAPLFLVTLGVGLLICGFALGVDPGLILGGGLVALLGADSCRKVQPLYVVVVQNGAETTESMTSTDPSHVEEFVAELSREIKRLRTPTAKQPRGESPQSLRAQAV